MFIIHICLLLALALCLAGQTPPADWMDLLDRTEEAIANGNFEKATEDLKTACRKPGDAVQAVLCWHDRGLLLQMQARYDEAESCYRAAVASWQRLKSSDERLVATTLHNLGEIYREMGRWEDARRSFTRALAARRAIYGDEHPLSGSAY